MTSSADLNFRLSGKKNKDTLLFLHGFMGSLADWDEVIADLKIDYRCLAVDLPGHGKTSLKDIRDYTMARTASAVISLLDSLGIGSCGIIAYSMGGRIAYYLLTHYPGRFTRAVIESASPGIQDPGERRARKQQDKLLSERLAKAGRTDFRHFLREWYSSGVFKGAGTATPRFKNLLRARMKNDPGKLAKALCGNGIGSQPSLWPEIAKISADLLLIAGEKDSKFRNINKLVEKRNSSIRDGVIKRAGHNIHFDRPVEYLKAVRTFLER